MELNDLERAVLEKFLAGDHPVLEKLRLQYKNCYVVKREFTGVGFFTTLAVHDKTLKIPLVTKGLTMWDVTAEIEGLKYGASFVLFIEDGFLDTLEGASDDEWPSSYSWFKVEYCGGPEPGKRDWEKLYKKLDEVTGKKGND